MRRKLTPLSACRESSRKCSSVPCAQRRALPYALMPDQTAPAAIDVVVNSGSSRVRMLHHQSRPDCRLIAELNPDDTAADDCNIGHTETSLHVNPIKNKKP